MCKKLKHNAISYVTCRRKHVLVEFQIVLVEIPILNIILNLDGDFNLS